MKLCDLKFLPEKERILYRLQENDYMKQLHRDIKEGLVGTLRNEYLMKKPMRKPYEEYVKEVDSLIGIPILHALVDMLVAGILTRVQEKLIDIVVDQALSDLSSKPLSLKQIIELGLKSGELKVENNTIKVEDTHA